MGRGNLFFLVTLTVGTRCPANVGGRKGVGLEDPLRCRDGRATTSETGFALPQLFYYNFFSFAGFIQPGLLPRT